MSEENVSVWLSDDQDTEVKLFTTRRGRALPCEYQVSCGWRCARPNRGPHHQEVSQTVLQPFIDQCRADLSAAQSEREPQRGRILQDMGSLLNEVIGVPK